MNPGLRIVVRGDAAHLEVHASAEVARRELGAVTWSVLEVLALAGQVVDGRWVATTNARDIATRLGIGKNAAAAALSSLRSAGLVVAHASRDATTARFAAGSYEVRVPVSRLENTREPVGETPRSPAPRTRTRARDASPSEPLDLFSSVE